MRVHTEVSHFVKVDSIRVSCEIIVEKFQRRVYGAGKYVQQELWFRWRYMLRSCGRPPRLVTATDCAHYLMGEEYRITVQRAKLLPPC